MEKEQNGIIVLCKKCYENNEYFIPLYQKGKKEYEIELICPKRHIMEKDNIIEKNLDDKLKLNIQNCPIHHEIFCGWSEEELRNICRYDIGGLHANNKKNYQLDLILFPNPNLQTSLKLHIEKINQVLEKLIKDTPDLKAEIEYLQILKKHFDINYNLYYTLHIHN